jgi:hypothetical protein
MAQWDQIQEQGNVEDRRSSKILRNVWGIWLWSIALLLVVGYFGWADTALQMLDDMQQNQVVQESSVAQDDLFAGQDEYEVFCLQSPMIK